MRKISVIAFAALCGFLVSCASTPAKKGARAEAGMTDASGDWELVSFEKDGEKITVVAATISVTNKGPGSYGISGFSGVNNYSGSLTADGHKITFAPGLASTRMMGPKEAMDFEADFLDLLANADTWTVTDAELALSGGNAVACFAKKGLDGTSWKLTGANTGNAVVSVNSSNKNITLSFAGGKATGFTGVNNMTLAYTTDEKSRSLTFADGPFTMRAGTEDEMKTERLFLDNIFKTASYSLSGSTLTLRDASGTTLLTFTKAE